ncbi:MAG: DUF3343 domain-containing protein [Clostridia bacterium]|nr:DUF3343 domain-containing protein [Clostridia bacterium]
MKKILVLSSVTYALRVQDILKQNGIYANLTRSRAVKSVRGCGYGVSFAPGDEPRVRALVSAANVPFLAYTEER